MIEREVGRIFEWGRLPGPQAGWGIVLVSIAILACAFFSWWELRQGWGKRSLWLAVLRVVALVAILLWFLDPRWRIQAERQYPSRVILLLDTSSSMLLPATLPSSHPGERAFLEPSGPSQMATRWEEAVKLLTEGRLCEHLARLHETSVYLFDEGIPQLLGVWPKASSGLGEHMGESGILPGSNLSEEDEAQTGAEPANPAGEEAVLLGEKILERLRELIPAGRETRMGDALVQVLRRHQSEALAGIVVLSDGGQNTGTSVAEAVQLARELQVPIITFGFGPTKALPDFRVAEVEVPSQVRPQDPFPILVMLGSENWEGPVRVEIGVEPAGVEERLRPDAEGRGLAAGDKDSASPGQAGRAEERVSKAGEEDSAIGDLQSSGQAWVFQEAREVALSPKDPSTTVKFEVSLAEPGRYRVVARVSAGSIDFIPENNTRQVEVEVVDRPLRVLLVGGGPSRDYQFLRSLLYRDENVFSSVLLQTAQPGISQEADEVLALFPQSFEELSRYDCIVAIDPDWRKLSSEDYQLPQVLGLLERWVAEQGGGLIVCAGAVHAGDSVAGWRADPRCETVLRLYPVVLRRDSSAATFGMYSTSDPWPLQLTLEGRSAPYLWLESGGRVPEELWSQFPGVFSCLQAVEAKRGATVLAYFSDPRSFELGRPPIYWAEQFYGAGRVFYIGSPETWRLRTIDERYFERFWIQLIRHVVQGRLHRDSLRLVLRTDREVYFQGETVFVRAQAWDAQFQPLDREVLLARISGPEGFWAPINLTAIPGEKGSFGGSFLPRRLGDYFLVASLPEDPGHQVQRRFRVELPQLEERQLVQNESLLRQLAESTGGYYYHDPASAVRPASEDFLLRRLPERVRVEPFFGPAIRPTLGHLLAAAVGRNSQGAGGISDEGLSRWVEAMRVPLDWALLGISILLLSCEWTLRRLWKLA
jgi:hypothetical protein